MNKKSKSRKKKRRINVQCTAKADDAIQECFNVLERELAVERNKPQSLENRVGIISTILTVIFVFLNDKIAVADIIKLMTSPVLFLGVIKIVAGILLYISFIFTILMAFKVINTKQKLHYDVTKIDDALMNAERKEVLRYFVRCYREIVVQQRNVNEKAAQYFRKAYLGTMVTIFSALMYVAIPY